MKRFLALVILLMIALLGIQSYRCHNLSLECSQLHADLNCALISAQEDQATTLFHILQLQRAGSTDSVTQTIEVMLDTTLQNAGGILEDEPDPIVIMRADVKFPRKNGHATKLDTKTLAGKGCAPGQSNVKRYEP